MSVMRRSQNQRGFTIIELLIATAIFSVIALIATSGIIKIGQMYYKGITVAKTQERNRVIIDDLAASIQFSDATLKIEPDPNRNIFCLGNTRYFYRIDKVSAQVKSSTPPSQLGLGGLVSQKLKSGYNCNTCSKDVSPAGCAEAPTQMLGENMRLLKLAVDPKVNGSSAWSISVALAYGDPDLLTGYDKAGDKLIDPPNTFCRSGIPGGSFCATSRLDTVVKRRLK